MRKIVFIVSLFIIPLEIMNIVYNISTLLNSRMVNPLFSFSGSLYIMEIIKGVFVVALCVCLIVWFFRKTNLTNSIRYTYEQYKEMRQKKTAEKQKAKKEKLQKQLNEIEKDTK